MRCGIFQSLGKILTSINLQTHARQRLFSAFLSQSGHRGVLDLDEWEDTMATATEATLKAVRECAEPAIAAVEENFEDVRRAFADGRQSINDCMAEARTEIRRHPFVTLSVAVGVGTVLGCLVGFTIGRFRGRAAG